ncbi:very short patch repair endonuclease [Azospirillum brasilense]|uniref:very short patch repair endonuclease n=1 Tax=Azospirillum brasilense TaxID=192 RepID=UPI000E0C18D6|nr:very short patch repair endonuclease [Azospirillum brasilense]
MSRIRGKDTKPEMVLRRGLHAAGLRFRLHARDLPGRPDLVFPRHRAIVLVHGCFWHGHGCPMCRLPATRTEFWAKKLESNRERDRRSADALRAVGWRLLTVWECSLRGRARLPLDVLLHRCSDFIRGWEEQAELAGDWPRHEAKT